jgi:hypothetical protein
MTRTKRKPAGIGTVGSCQAKYFHPKKEVMEALKEDYTKHTINNVLIIGKGKHRINNRELLAYKCCLPDINKSITFVVVKSLL